MTLLVESLLWIRCELDFERTSFLLSVLIMNYLCRIKLWKVGPSSWIFKLGLQVGCSGACSPWHDSSTAVILMVLYIIYIPAIKLEFHHSQDYKQAITGRFFLWSRLCPVILSPWLQSDSGLEMRLTDILFMVSGKLSWRSHGGRQWSTTIYTLKLV